MKSLGEMYNQILKGFHKKKTSRRFSQAQFSFANIFVNVQPLWKEGKEKVAPPGYGFLFCDSH